jgi:ComF family protein
MLPQPQCERCGYPVAGGPGAAASLAGTAMTCRWCALLPAYVRAARSVCWMPDGAAGALVHAFKYDGWWRLGDDLGAAMARLAWPADVQQERTALVPVPLAARRERERGFNQSLLLAESLAARWQIPVWRDLLRRTRSTRTQTRLTPDQRFSNVAGAFRLDGPPRPRGAHVLLVDDVVTTAATMNACAAALFDGGARIISYVSFGRARLPGDAPT